MNRISILAVALALVGSFTLGPQTANAQSCCKTSAPSVVVAPVSSVPSAPNVVPSAPPDCPLCNKTADNKPVTVSTEVAAPVALPANTVPAGQGVTYVSGTWNAGIPVTAIPNAYRYSGRSFRR